MSEKSAPQCPICEEEVAPLEDNPTFPFCSTRCKNEDLGKWFGGEYSVAGRPASPHEIAREVTGNDER